MKASWIGVLIGVLTLGAACGESEQVINARLQPLSSCADVEDAIRGAALLEMNRRLDEAQQQWLEGRCYWGRSYEDADGMAMAGAPAPQSTTANKSGGSASQVSGTNNQVVGVDEADFVKNDNKYIYVVRGSTFRIIEAWPAATAHEIAKVDIEGEGKKVFVHADRALVYSALQQSSSNDAAARSNYYRQQECTYGYNCVFTGDGLPTKITVLDISDRSAPKLVREVTLSGSFLTARRIGSAVHTVLSFPGVTFEGLKYYPEDVSGELCYQQQYQTIEDYFSKTTAWQMLVYRAFAKLRAENTRIIEEAELTDWMPSLSDTIHSGDTTDGGKAETTDTLLGDCKGFYKASLNDGGQFTTVLSLDITKEDTASAATIVSPPGAVYASGEALYLSVPRERAMSRGWYGGSYENVEQNSTVHKFLLDSEPPSASYAASGVVKGRVLNQFSMDEREGFLRIATTNGHVPSPDVYSTLTVLQQKDDVLLSVGKVDKLAPKEDIRSVRFADDRGYIVTFKKTDPLFVLDLADPFDPQLRAELKIPGFSTYMHMMDDQHLLTIGYDADDQGDFAWFTGVMLQIFDVSDPTDPQLSHKKVIGTRGSSSEALTNHLAFNYFAPKDLLALPMTICEGSAGGGNYGTQMTFSGLMVFDVTTDAGFALRGQVPHLSIEGGQQPSCGNWWTNATSVVRRSIIMDDYVYSVSDSQIKVNHLDDLMVDLVSLPLQ